MAQMDQMSNWLKTIIDKNIQNNQIDVKDVSQLVKSKELSVEDLVVDLGPLLTNSEAKERNKGLYILSQVIHELPQNFLSEKEVEHLTIFYCDRLKDHYSVIPNVFSGLLAISKCLNHPQDLSQMIFNSLVKETVVQQYSVSERFMVYQLLTQLFERHSEEFKKIRVEFIYGLIQIIEGERDPRCLLVVFRLTHNVIKSIELEPYSEDFFEVISCYFPILFTPPPNDEYGITKEDLSSALEMCFKASSAFAEFLFPLLLEKLESELTSAKIDSYRVMQICCPNYGYEKIEAFLLQVWTCIRIDSLKPNLLENEVSESALKALTAISDTMTSNPSDIDSLIELVWKDIEPAFHKPELELMESATNIVIATISSNVYTFNKLIAQLMPLLLQQFTFSQIESHRIQIINSISRILTHSKKLSKQINLKNSDSLFMLLTALSVAETESDSLRASVIECLQQLVLSLSEVKAEQWKIISQVLDTLLNNYLNSQKLLTKSYLLLESVALLNPNLVKEKIVQPMINDFDPSYSTESNQKRLNCTLTVFEVASSELSIFQLIVPHLVNQIKLNSYFIDEDQETYSMNLTKCLSNCISKHTKVKMGEKTNSFLYDECFDPLIQHCIHVSICTDNKSSTTINMKLMKSLYLLIGKGVSGLDSQYSQQLFDKLLEFSIFGKVDKLLRVVPPSCFCTFVNGPLFFDHLNDTQAFIVFGLVHALLCNLKYNCNDEQIIELLDKLVYHSINNYYKNSTVCRLAAQSVSAIINRFDDKNVGLNAKINQLSSVIEEKLYDNNETEDNKLIGLDLCIWITKGLVIAGHIMRKQLITLLINLLETENRAIKTKVSNAFALIYSSDECLLTCDNNAIVKILYRQSFYYETFEPLLNGYLRYKSLDLDKKQFYLTSLLTQLSCIPKTVFRSELNRLLPMLLDAISEENSLNNQMVALDSISQILIDKNVNILDPSLKSTVTNCVDLALNSPYLKVRRSALNCLSHIANSFDDSILSHFRDQVVRNLRKTLNDKKRIVRQSAVRARCKWILVGQPGK